MRENCSQLKRLKRHGKQLHASYYLQRKENKEERTQEQA